MAQKERFGAIVPVLGGVVFGIVLFFIGRALKSHFEFNAAFCNTFNATTASCAGNTFLYDMGGVVEYLGIFAGIAGILGGLGLSMSGRNQTRPAAGSRPAAGAALSPGSPLGQGQIPPQGNARTGATPAATRPSPQPAVSHPPAAGATGQPQPAGPASSAAVPAAWISAPPASAPPVPRPSAGPPQSPTEPGQQSGQ